MTVSSQGPLTTNTDLISTAPLNLLSQKTTLRIFCALQLFFYLKIDIALKKIASCFSKSSANWLRCRFSTYKQKLIILSHCKRYPSVF